MAGDIGFLDDAIFLLSIEEYKLYRNNIPKFLGGRWWLRSPVIDQKHAANVDYDGVLSCELVIIRSGCVRPALRISNLESEYLAIGERLVKYDFPWIKIADNIAIAESPVNISRFDDKSNDYESSEIRDYLVNWIDRRLHRGVPR